MQRNRFLPDILTTLFDRNGGANTDSRVNGRAQSSGAMVNCPYDLTRVEQNHENFVLHGKVAASRTIHALAKAAFKTKLHNLAP